MDDLLAGSNNQIDLLQCLLDAREAFESAGFCLHKIHSNVKLPDLESVESANLLGLVWSPFNDTLQLKQCNLNVSTLTKRSMLSVIGRMFDPIGLSEPFKLNLRLLFSQVKSKEWNEPISSSLASEWNRFISDLPDFSSIQINRCVNITGGRMSRNVLNGWTSSTS